MLAELTIRNLKIKYIKDYGAHTRSMSSLDCGILTLRGVCILNLDMKIVSPDDIRNLFSSDTAANTFRSSSVGGDVLYGNKVFRAKYLERVLLFEPRLFSELTLKQNLDIFSYFVGSNMESASLVSDFYMAPHSNTKVQHLDEWAKFVAVLCVKIIIRPGLIYLGDVSRFGNSIRALFKPLAKYSAEKDIIFLCTRMFDGDLGLHCVMFDVGCFDSYIYIDRAYRVLNICDNDEILEHHKFIKLAMPMIRRNKLRSKPAIDDISSIKLPEPEVFGSDYSREPLLGINFPDETSASDEVAGPNQGYRESYIDLSFNEGTINGELLSMLNSQFELSDVYFNRTLGYIIYLLRSFYRLVFGYQQSAIGTNIIVNLAGSVHFPRASCHKFPKLISDIDDFVVYNYLKRYKILRNGDNTSSYWNQELFTAYTHKITSNQQLIAKFIHTRNINLRVMAVIKLIGIFIRYIRQRWRRVASVYLIHGITCSMMVFMRKDLFCGDFYEETRALYLNYSIYAGNSTCPLNSFDKLRCRCALFVVFFNTLANALYSCENKVFRQYVSILYSPLEYLVALFALFVMFGWVIFVPKSIFGGQMPTLAVLFLMTEVSIITMLRYAWAKGTPFDKFKLHYAFELCLTAYVYTNPISVSSKQGLLYYIDHHTGNMNPLKIMLFIEGAEHFKGTRLAFFVVRCSILLLLFIISKVIRW